VLGSGTGATASEAEGASAAGGLKIEDAPAPTVEFVPSAMAFGPATIGVP
jgi:hypothetical protein